MKIRHSRIGIALTALLALTACDLYSDSGKWSGDLAVHDDGWHERYNCSVSVDISHTESVVSLNSVDSFCGERSLHWSPKAMSRRGMALYRDDAEVGSVLPDGTVKVDLVDPSARDDYPNRADRVSLTWTRMGDDLQFSLTEYTEGRSRTMEGLLHRVN